MLLLYESIDTLKNLKFVKISKDEALDNIKKSNNKDSLNKLKFEACWGFKECQNYKIIYKNAYIGNIGICNLADLFKLSNKQDKIKALLYVNSGGIPFCYIHKCLYISYLEINNVLRNITNISPVDILLSLLQNIIENAKLENYAYIVCNGKNERLDRFYLRGGFKLSPYLALSIYKMLFRCDRSPLVYSLTQTAKKMLEDSYKKQEDILNRFKNKLNVNEMKTNNKALYESIMKNVSREVKRALNETELKDDKVKKAADKLCAELKKYNKRLDSAIDLMKIISVATTNVKDYSDPRFKRNKYEGVGYDKLIPELESRL